MNKENLLQELKERRSKIWYEWEALELLTFNSEYQEPYEDTITRLTLDGIHDGLTIAIQLIESEAN